MGGISNASAFDLPVSDEIIVENLYEEELVGDSDDLVIVDEFDEITVDESSELIPDEESYALITTDVIEPEAGDPEAQYTINILRDTNGSVDVSPNYTAYTAGTNVTLTATPDVSGHPKYRFAYWDIPIMDDEGNVIRNDRIYENPYTFQITSDVYINAMFEELPTINAFGDNFDMSAADYSATVRGISFYYFEEEQYGFAIGNDYKPDIALTSYNCPWKKFSDDESVVDYSPKINKFYADWVPNTSLGSAFQKMSNCNEFVFGSNFRDNLSNVTNMSNMFDGCDSLPSQLDIKNWNASNVKSTSYMFKNCKSLTGVKLPVLNSDSFESLEGMFSGCTKLTTITNIENINSESVSSFSHMFEGCSSLKTLDLTFNTKSASFFEGMFKNCVKLEELNLGDNVITYISQPKSYADMFSGCHSLKNIDLSGFYIKSDCVVDNMLADCYSLQKIITPKAGYIGDNEGIIVPDQDALANPLHYYEDVNFTPCTVINKDFLGCTLIKDVITVSFDTNGPEGKTTTPATIPDRIVGYGYKLGNLPVVSCGEEYTFNNQWYYLTYDEEQELYVKNYVTKDTIVNFTTDTLTLYAEWIRNTYITLESNDGSYGKVSFDASESSYKTSDSKWLADTNVLVYAKPNDANYEFVEWEWTDPVKGPQTSTNSKLNLNGEGIVEDTVLTAVFRPKNTYTVTVDTSNLAYGSIYYHYGNHQGNVTPTDNVFTINQGEQNVFFIVTPTDPTIDRFMHWNWTSDSGSGQGNEGETRFEIDNINSNYELSTVFLKVPHIVYKSGISGTTDVIDTNDYDDRDTATVWDNTFTNPGYRFIGWSTVINGNTITFQPGDKITYSAYHDVELTAIWHEIHYCNVTFYSNDGISSTPVVDSVVAYGCDDLPKSAAPSDRKDVFVVKNPGSPTIVPGADYTFNGWYTDTTYSKKYDFNKQIDDQNIDIDINIYALWNQTYTVKFNGNGHTSGSMPSQKFVYNVSSRLNNCEFKKTGYRFVGWGTDKTTMKYSNFANIYNLTPENTSVTLYAIWEPVKYTLTYSLNGGVNNTNNKKTYTVKDTVKLYNATRKGYTFAGWYLEPNYKTKVTELSVGTTGNRYLYAKWKMSNFKITYVLSGGKNNTANPASFTLADTVILKNPQRSGYIFKGWYTDSKYKNRVTQIKKGTIGNLTLYAKWQGYKITYVLRGGTNNKKNPTIYNGGSTVNLYSATRKGYTFGGWYLDTKYKKRVKSFKAGDTGDVKLYAQWIPYKYYIKFMKNGSGATGYMSTRKYSYGKWYELPQLKYKRKGYSFIEWNTKADGSGKSYEDMDSFLNITTKNNKIIKLYAIWEKD